MPYTLRLALLLPLLTAELIADPKSTAPNISRAEAIKVAEKFVRDNGYTETRGLPSDKLVGESIEWFDRSKWAEWRHGLLAPKAHRSARGRKRGEPGWTVIFQYRRLGRLDHGRVVTMDPSGGNVRIEHLDFNLNKLQRE